MPFGRRQRIANADGPLYAFLKVEISEIGTPRAHLMNEQTGTSS
jgi:hypothetical protein